MSTFPVSPGQPPEHFWAPKWSERTTVRVLLAGSSLFFAFLQSVCTFFAALDGVRLLLSAGALAFAAGAGDQWEERLHVDWIRVPMLAFAFAGSVLTLTIVLHLRHLRGRGASLWRQQPLTSRKLRMERIQLALSVTTLIVIAVEELVHHHYYDHF